MANPDSPLKVGLVRLGEKAVFTLHEYRQVAYHEAARRTGRDQPDVVAFRRHSPCPSSLIRHTQKYTLRGTIVLILVGFASCHCLEETADLEAAAPQTTRIKERISALNAAFPG